jgi:hypothetical protein
MPYSNDRRRKLLEAWQQWDGTQRELAQLFFSDRPKGRTPGRS